MADDALKVKVQLEATTDTKQVQKEATEVADTAQKTLDKKQLKLKIDDNLKDLKKKLEETRVAYENLLNQPMNWTTNQQLEKLEDQMEDLRNEIKENEKALNDLWGTGNKLWNVFKNLVGKISALWAAMKVFQTLKKMFVDFQESQKTLVQATGASGDALRQLSDDMLAVQGKVWQSQWEIAEAVWELNTRLWLTWKELQDFTTKYLKFASVTWQDVKWAIESNVKMFSIWGITAKQQAEYLDKLTVAGQKTWISVQNLTNQLQANAPVLQELWFSLDDSIALLSNFEQAWVEASQVLQSMKMWLKNLADDGVSPAQKLEEVIKWVQDWTIGLEEAMDIFWSRWWVAMYNAIKNGTFALWDMKKALEDVNWAVEKTFSDMETWWDLFTRLWEWAKSEITSFANDSFYNFQQIVEFNKEWFKQTKDLIQWHTELTLVYNKETGAFEWLQAVYKDDYYNKMKLQEATDKLEKKTSEFNEAIEESNNALKAFSAISVNQSSTRSDFEATRQQAIATTEAVVGLLKTLAQLNNQKIDTKKLSWEAITWADLKEKFDIQKRLWLAIDNLNKLKNSTYKWKDDGWAVGEALLWWKGGGWWSKSKAEDMAQSFQKEMKELYNDMDSSVSEHQNKLDKAKENIKKVEDQYDKLRDAAKKTREDAEKSIKKYNEQLEKNQSDAITNLGQRYVELKKELMGADEWMKKRAEELSWKEIQSMQDWWSTEYRGYELKDLIELKEKLDELKLIEENTTEEQRKSEEFTKKTSKAQEILNNLNEKAAELEDKKATALEKQAIAQSVMNQENWKQNIVSLTKNWEDIGTYYYDIMEKTRKKIEDEDNVQYAKQLENQSVNLKDQLEQYTQEKNKEVETLVDITARKGQLEKEYTKVFQDQVTKQKQSVNDLIQRWEVLIAKKNEYYWTSTSARAYGWDITNAKVSLVWENWPEQIVARTASYIQPRNANNTYNTTTTNDNSFSINWMQINVNNVDDFLDELRQRMTYRK